MAAGLARGAVGRGGLPTWGQGRTGQPGLHTSGHKPGHPNRCSSRLSPGKLGCTASFQFVQSLPAGHQPGWRGRQSSWTAGAGVVRSDRSDSTSKPGQHRLPKDVFPVRHTGQCDSLSVPKPWRSNWPCTQSLGLQQREVPAQTASLEVTATEATEGLVYNAHTTRRDIVIIPTLSRFGRCSDPRDGSDQRLLQRPSESDRSATQPPRPWEKRSAPVAACHTVGPSAAGSCPLFGPWDSLCPTNDPSDSSDPSQGSPSPSAHRSVGSDGAFQGESAQVGPP